MQITLTLSLDDSVASEFIQNAGLAIGIQGMTDEEVVAKLKEKIRSDLRKLVIAGAELKKQAEAKAAAEAQITALVEVT